MITLTATPYNVSTKAHVLAAIAQAVPRYADLGFPVDAMDAEIAYPGPGNDEVLWRLVRHESDEEAS